MIFELDKYTILIDDNAMKEVLIHQNGDHKKECGGIILGSTTNDNRIIIRSIPKATKDSKSSKYSCIRDKNIAQEIMNKTFEESNGKIIYVGEWHTHPVNSPTFSSQDRKMIEEQFKSNKICTDSLLMLIIGKKELELSLYTNNKLISYRSKICK